MSSVTDHPMRSPAPGNANANANPIPGSSPPPQHTPMHTATSGAPSTSHPPPVEMPMNYHTLAVETDLMSVLRDWVSRGPNIVANVFGERNHQITSLKQEIESLSIKLSNETYETDRLRSEVAHLRSEVHRLEEENNRLRVETASAAEAANAASAPIAGSVGGYGYGDDDLNKNNNNKQGGNHHNNRNNNVNHTKAIKHLERLLNEAKIKCNRMESRANEMTKQRDVAMKKLKDREPEDQSMLFSLVDVAGYTSANPTFKKVLDAIHCKLSVLKKRVEDESKAACTEAQRARENERNVEKAEKQLKIEKERCAGLRRDLKAQKEAMQKQIDGLNRKVTDYEKQINRVRQIAGLSDTLGTDNTNNDSGKTPPPADEEESSSSSPQQQKTPKKKNTSKVKGKNTAEKKKKKKKKKKKSSSVPICVVDSDDSPRPRVALGVARAGITKR